MKKVNYQRILKYIPEHSARIMLKPNKSSLEFNRMGPSIIVLQHKLLESHLNDVYDFAKVNIPKVFDYLSIIDINDFSYKINVYNNFN
jgi:hypothetical protein